MNIPCIDGCPPDRVNIHTDEQSIRWTYQPSFGKPPGKIEGVRGLPEEFFAPGQKEGSSFVVLYKGAPEGKLWSYEVDSDPKCPVIDDDVPPQLTSGP